MVSTSNADAAVRGASINPNARNEASLWVYPALTWLLVIVASPILMMPNSDDPFYFLPALGLLRDGELAVNVNGTIERIFFNFPTYSFFQGVFLKLADVVGIPVHYYTHRLFHGLVVIALLVLSLPYVGTVATRIGSDAGSAKLWFLILIGLNPFAQTWVLVRPEPLGLLFLVASLLAYQSWVGSGRSRRLWLYASALLLGVPLTTHPIFVPLCGIVLLAYLYLELRQGWDLGRLVLLVALGGVALVPLTAFYLVHYPDSVAQLIGQTKGAESVYFGGFRGLPARAIPIGSDPLLTRLVSAIFYFPLFVLLLAGAATVVVLARRLIRQNTDVFLPLLFLFLSVSIVLALLFNFNYVLGVVGFVGALFIAPIWGAKISELLRRIFGRFTYSLLAVGSIVIVGLWAEMHVAKFTAFPDRFLRPGVVLNIVESAATDPARLFIAVRELVPLFVHYLDATNRLGAANAPLPTYWLFLDSGKSVKSVADLVRMRSFLEDEIESGAGQDLWFVNGQDLDSNSMSACVRIRLVPFSIGLEVGEVLYQDHRYALVRSVKQRMGCA